MLITLHAAARRHKVLRSHSRKVALPSAVTPAATSLSSGSINKCVFRPLIVDDVFATIAQARSPVPTT